MQFLYLMGGGMIIYASFELAEPALFWIIAVPVAILTICLAFIKIQDQPFSKFVLSALLFAAKAKKRHWFKDPTEEKFLAETLPEKQIKKTKVYEPKKVEKSELEKLASVLDVESMEKIAEHQNIKLDKKISDQSKPTNNKNQPAKEEAVDIFG